MAMTSASLLVRLRDIHDQDAWARVLDLYGPLIRHWADRLNVRGADADDLVQEVLAVVVRRFPEFVHPEKPGAFRGWLRAIAVNCARDVWRQRRIAPVVPGGTDFVGYLNQLEDPDHPLSREWDREHDVFVTRRLLDRLKAEFEPRTWELFRRFVMDGLPADQVAAEFETSPNAVYIAKSRVMARLRAEAEGLIG
jgi:RNA polymerase sigma-70 factor (ECF subfamily)